MMFKIVNGMTLRYLKEIFFPRDRVPPYTTPEHRWMILPYQGPERTITGAKIWNALPNNMKSVLSLETFRNKLKSLDLSIDI